MCDSGWQQGDFSGCKSPSIFVLFHYIKGSSWQHRSQMCCGKMRHHGRMSARVSKVWFSTDSKTFITTDRRR